MLCQLYNLRAKSETEITLGYCLGIGNKAITSSVSFDIISLNIYIRKTFFKTKFNILTKEKSNIYL